MAGWNTCNRCMQIRQRLPASPKAGWTAACNCSATAPSVLIYHVSNKGRAAQLSSCTVMVAKHNSKCIEAHMERWTSSVICQHFSYEPAKVHNCCCSKERMTVKHFICYQVVVFFVSFKQLHTLLSSSQSHATRAREGRFPGKQCPSEAKLSTCVWVGS